MWLVFTGSKVLVMHFTVLAYRFNFLMPRSIYSLQSELSYKLWEYCSGAIARQDFVSVPGCVADFKQYLLRQSTTMPVVIKGEHYFLILLLFLKYYSAYRGVLLYWNNTCLNIKRKYSMVLPQDF